MKRGLVLGCLLAGAAPVALAQGTATPTNPVGTTIPGIGTPAPGTAGQPAPGLRDRPQLRLVPGITGVTGGSVLSQPGAPRFQYYVLNAITVGFRGLGQQGEVRIRLDALPLQDETGGTGPRGPRCQFVPLSGSLASPAVVGPDGTAQAQYTGAFVHRDMQLLQDGTCRLRATVQRRQPNLTYADEAQYALPLLTIMGHEEVRITDTARLRDFLRPVASPDCETADQDGKFGQRVSARVRGAGCRTDMLDPRDTRPGMFGAPTMNILKDGVIVHRLSWRLEGDQNVCGLCDNPLGPCRNPVQQAAVVLANVLVPMRWLYAPLRTGTMHVMSGGWFALLGGPPKMQRATPVRVDTRTDDYDTTFTDAISRMLLENQDGGPEVIGEGTGRWHSWMRPFSTRLDCRPWAPSPGAVGSAIGGALTGGGRPQAPPPPPLRLVLDEIVFWRPQGRSYLAPGES